MKNVSTSSTYLIFDPSICICAFNVVSVNQSLNFRTNIWFVISDLDLIENHANIPSQIKLQIRTILKKKIKDFAHARWRHYSQFHRPSLPKDVYQPRPQVRECDLWYFKLFSSIWVLISTKYRSLIRNLTFVRRKNVILASFEIAISAKMRIFLR